ncbi:hypothetical protein EDB84DRAFT_1486957 [Lactarius hengduanensis]|nr:hypothetical protein EDB84DRAFT_1486957 [Lactarius hengduanensis]
MSRIKLADISALTLYQGESTSSRRGKPIPQLVCKGKPCKSFTPDVVRCANLGGEGTDVDWKCETDLPESLRLGRVQVSCEGWSGPGDSHVLKGSCSLEYRLQEVPKAYRPASHSHSSQGSSTSEALMDYLYNALVMGVLAFVLYSLLRPCFEGRHRVSPPRAPRPDPSSNLGWFRWGQDHPRRPPPPPPYSNATGSQVRGDQDRFGFWSGAALGGLGTYLLTRQRESAQPQPRRYDWENERHFARPDPVPVPRASGSSSRQQSWESREGPSNLGSMRRSTGYGNSTVR